MGRRCRPWLHKWVKINLVQAQYSCVRLIKCYDNSVPLTARCMEDFTWFWVETSSVVNFLNIKCGRRVVCCVVINQYMALHISYALSPIASQALPCPRSTMGA